MNTLIIYCYYYLFKTRELINIPQGANLYIRGQHIWVTSGFRSQARILFVSLPTYRMCSWYFFVFPRDIFSSKIQTAVYVWICLLFFIYAVCLFVVFIWFICCCWWGFLLTFQYFEWGLRRTCFVHTMALATLFHYVLELSSNAISQKKKA